MEYLWRARVIEHFLREKSDGSSGIPENISGIDENEYEYEMI